MADLPDLLTVAGFGRPLDGDYPCDVIGMTTPGNPELITSREGRRIQEISDARGGEILDEFVRYNTDVHVALAVVVLERAGKRPDVDALRDKRIGDALLFTIGDRDEADEGDAGPPDGTDMPLTTGGSSSAPTSGSQGNGLRLTGAPDSEKSPASDPVTLGI